MPEITEYNEPPNPDCVVSLVTAARGCGTRQSAKWPPVQTFNSVLYFCRTQSQHCVIAASTLRIKAPNIENLRTSRVVGAEQQEDEKEQDGHSEQQIQRPTASLA
jgi:hypothetical protein